MCLVFSLELKLTTTFVLHTLLIGRTQSLHVGLLMTDFLTFNVTNREICYDSTE